MESEIYPVKEYVEQASIYLSKLHNISIEEATSFVKQQIRQYSKNPTVTYNLRQDNGDKVIKTCKLISYIQDSLKDQDVIVPSFTTYLNNTKQKSIHSEFMLSNTKKRSVYKKAAFKAKQDGNMDLFNNMNSMQKATKILNNSLSGVYGSKSTILYNPSAHYTLTSITRCLSSIGNAVTESLIYGNKHFKSPEIVYNYITTILNNMDRVNVSLCIDKYKLHIPSPEEVMSMVKYSTTWYWRDTETENSILNFIRRLTSEERVAVMYTNDLWHMKMYNEKNIRNMLSNIIKIVPNPELDFGIMETTPELYQILVKFILNKDIRGMNVNYKELEGTELGYKMFGTIKHILTYMEKLELLFKTFFTTKILPPSIAYIKEMFRDGIILSDTDSTCCSYDKWIEWYNEPEQNVAIAGTLVTILTIVIENALLYLSTNMNIAPELRKVLAMKNEFYWPVFISNNTNKHYFASVLIQEGNVFKEEELEVKGVHFIASKANQGIVGRVRKMMVDILTKLGQGQDISILEYMQQVKDMEQEIIARAYKGDTEILPQMDIKDKSAYSKGEEQSNYLHYLLWEEVFKDKYGESGKPPYRVVKISTNLPTAKTIKTWLDNMEDKQIANKLLKFFIKYNRNSFNTFYLPTLQVKSKGIPVELLPVLNTRKLILDNLGSAYAVLESLGVYLKPEQIISDIY